MSKPAVVGTVSTGRGDIEDHTVIPNVSEPSRTEVKSFARTWQWIINSNGSATGFDLGTLTIDEGWHVIPYHYLQASVTAPDFQELVSNAQKIRIKSVGFEVGRMVMTKEELSAISGTTTVRADFVAEPTVLHIHDEEHEWGTMVRVKDDVTSSKFSAVSNNLTEQWATSKDSATLVRGVFKLPDGFNGSQYTKEVLTPHNVWTTLNDPSLHTISGDYSYEWSNGSHWYGLGTWIGMDKNTYKGDIGTMSNMMTDNGIMQESEMQVETETNYFHSPPPLHLLRVTPYYGTDGPIEQSCTMFIKCTSTIEVVKRSRNILTLNKRRINNPSTPQQTSSLALTSAYAGPLRPYDLFRFNVKKTLLSNPSGLEDREPPEKIPKPHGPAKHFRPQKHREESPEESS